MEPWPFSHGNDVDVGNDGTEELNLQWSHGPLAMETAYDYYYVDSAIDILQWSHGPLAMETCC